MKTSEWFKPVEDLGLKEYAGVLIPDGKLCQLFFSNQEDSVQVNLIQERRRPLAFEGLRGMAILRPGV